jgi:outer membrane immunogenic protein
LNQSFRVKQEQHQQTRGCAVPVRKYLPSAIVLASMFASPAFAADQPVLPWLPPVSETSAPLHPFGDELPVVRHAGWEGFYIGAQIGYTYGSADFSKSTQAPVAYSLRNTTLEAEYMPSNLQVLGTGTRGVASFGGFIGYNFEYLTPNAKVIMGFEATYEQVGLSLYAPSTPITRVLADVADTVTISATGSATDLNYGTLRARAGWAAGNFLPYGFIGLALGRANVNIAETTVVTENTAPFTAFPLPGTNGTNGEWLYGVTVGAGLDVALTPNLFLRGEYEYVQFQQVAGTTIELNTARFGAGFKF